MLKPVVEKELWVLGENCEQHRNAVVVTKGTRA